MDSSDLRPVIWVGLLLGGLVDLYNLSTLLRRSGADGSRPSPVLAVPWVLYLMSAAVANAADVPFPAALGGALALAHPLIVLPCVARVRSSRRAS